mgnify:FL=1
MTCDRKCQTFLPNFIPISSAANEKGDTERESGNKITFYHANEVNDIHKN